MATAQPTTAAAPSATINPVIIALAMALNLTTSDVAVHRAVDSALVYLSSAPVFEFDGVELRLVSLSERAAGTIHVTDGVACTCKSGHRPVCRCRVLFRLLFAQAALTEPTTLLASIAEQTDPNPVGCDDDTDALDDAADELHQIEGGTAEDWERYHTVGAMLDKLDAMREGNWDGPVISLVETVAEDEKVALKRNSTAARVARYSTAPAKQYRVSDAELTAAAAFFD